MLVFWRAFDLIACCHHDSIKTLFWLWCISYRSSMMDHDFYDITWVLAFLSRWRFWVWKVVLFCFLPCKAAKLFFFWLWCISYRSSMMDLVFHGITWFSLRQEEVFVFWRAFVLVACCLPDSIKLLFWMWCNSHRSSMMDHDFYDINWVLPFLSRWRFWVWKVVFFCFLPCKAVKSFFLLIVMRFVPLQYDGPWFSWP